MTRANSNAIVSWIKSTSNSVVSLNARETSLETTVRTDSNAFAYGIKNNSNAILSGSSSLAINNSNAIIALKTTVRTDSNAFAYGIKNNSNAILSGSSSLAINNSNAIVSWIKGTSNAVIKLSGTAPAALPVNNSNAIVSWIKQTSNALDWLNIIVRTDSNAFAYGIKNNSNAIIKLNSATPSGLVVQNSNAIVSWIKDTSNAVNKISPLVSGDVYYNVTMNESIFINSNQFINITNPNGVVIDGSGQTIVFNNTSGPQFIVQENVPVTLENVTLANINQNTFNILQGGQLLIGANTTFEFTENVTFSTGTFNVLDSPDGTVCTFVSLSGNNVVTFNDEAVLNLGDNTLRLENIELGSITNIDYGSNNLIELAADASVDIDTNTYEAVGLNFKAIGPNNAITLMQDNLTLSGLITFGDASVNELAVRFVLVNGLDPERVSAGELYPIVNFTGGPGIMLGGSPINVDRLILENPYTIFDLLDSNAILFDQNGQIFFKELELRDNNIKQYSSNVLVDGTRIIGHQIDPSFIRAYYGNQNHKQSITVKPISKPKTKIQVQPKTAKVKEKIEKNKVSETQKVTQKQKSTAKNTKTNFKDKKLKINHNIAKNRKGIDELNEILGIEESKDDSLMEELDCLCDDSNN